MADDGREEERSEPEIEWNGPVKFTGLTMLMMSLKTNRMMLIHLIC